MVCREVRNGKAKLVLIWENSFVYATVEKIERLRYDVVCVVMGVEVRKLGCFSGLPAIEAQHWAGCRAASRNGRARTKTLKRRPGVVVQVAKVRTRWKYPRYRRLDIHAYDTELQGRLRPT